MALPSTCHFGLRLNGFQPGDDLVFRDLVAFLDVDINQPAHRVCADVYVFKRLNLPRRGYHRSEILANGPSCLNGYDSALIVAIAGVCSARNHEQTYDADEDFPFSFHKNTPSPRSVYTHRNREMFGPFIVTCGFETRIQPLRMLTQ